MSLDNRYYLVEGKTPQDTPIRPHNWAERFAGNLASFGRDCRLRYASELSPVMVDGIKCLRVARSLEASHPTLLQDIIKFAALHDLKVHGLDDRDLELPLAS